MQTAEAQEPVSEASGQNEIARGRLLTFGSLTHAALAAGGVLPALCLVQIAEQFQLNDAQCGFFFAVSPTVTLFTLPVVGQLSERWGKRGLLVAGMILLAIAMTCYRSADAYEVLLLGSTALGLSCACVDALVSPLLVDLFPTRNAPVMNLVHCCFQVGIVGTALVAGTFLAREGLWTNTFLPVTIVAAVVALGFAVTRFPPALKHATPMRIGGLLSQGSFWLCMVVIAVAGGVEAGILVWVPTFLQRQFDMAATGVWLTEQLGLVDPEPLLGGIGLALFAAPMVVGRWFYGSLAERCGYVAILMVSCVVSAVALVGLWWASTAATSIAWLALLGLAMSGVWPTLLIYAAAIIQANPQTLFSLLAMAGLAGVGICSWGIGQLAELSGDIHMGLCALLMPLAAALAALTALSRITPPATTPKH
ncbi:MAG: MFS transporter [Planctomycetales bacterium]|nr:MFS transporter [Planctomycetales bacterium]